MTLVIVATVGAANANSFVTEAEQIAYMATKLNASAWTTFTGTACTEPEKQAMISATRELSVRTWMGTRAGTTQALSWPRWFVINPDVPWAGLTYYDSTIIPQRVKDATMELAFQFLNLGTTDLSALDPTLNYVRKNIAGAIDTEYVDPWHRAKGLARFPLVLQQVKPLLADVGTTISLVRG